MAEGIKPYGLPPQELDRLVRLYDRWRKAPPRSKERRHLRRLIQREIKRRERER